MKRRDDKFGFLGFSPDDCSQSKNKLWQPKATDRIYSRHFVGNRKSNVELHPAYNPTIFPTEYKKQGRDTTARYNRANKLEKARARANETSNPVEAKQEASSSALNDSVFPKPSLLTNHAACQVNFAMTEEGSMSPMNFLFECDFSKHHNSVSTQANIVLDSNIDIKQKTVDKCVGNSDNIECGGFHGYRSVSNDEEMSSLCGVSLVVFHLLTTHLSDSHGNEKLCKENRLFLFLAKLKLGISFRALAVFFNMHHSSTSRIFINTLNELVQKMYNYIYWPSSSVIGETMPLSFKTNYPNCRVIIDCTEMKIERPNGVDNQIYTYSSYKSGFTAKFLIGIAPSGFISFVSRCYGGRSSDSFITNDCSILDLLEKNDVVLADNGFPGIKCDEDVLVVMPPFVHDGVLTVEEVEKGYSVASVRIHVERSIQRVKTFNILQYISHKLFPHIDLIVRMCGILANLQSPIIKHDKNENQMKDNS